jgi:aldehyde dehydrogenase (NAD+)
LELFKSQIAANDYRLDAHNYVKIINERHLARLKNLIDQDKIALGGQIDALNRVIAPTLLKDVQLSDAIMQEEIFGPLLPLIKYQDFEEVLQYIENNEKPLSAYLFSNDPTEQKNWEQRLSFGGGCINDAIMHITNPNLPFGGVGQSGTGSYHGKAGFDTFSHFKSVFKKPNIFEVPLKYPPYTSSKMAWIKRLLRFS